MNESNIVNISGRPLPDPEKPVPAVVVAAERFLKMARDGELRGFAIAYLYRDGGTGCSVQGEVTWAMVGRAAAAQRWAIQVMEGKYVP